MGVKRHEGNEKREALVKAASSLSFKRGLNGWTIADLAEEANVPIGNVFYYGRLKRDFQVQVVNQLTNEFFTSKTDDELRKLRLTIESELFKRGL